MCKLILGLLVLNASLGTAVDSPVQICVFEADVTPPIGSSLCFGLVPPAKEIVDRLSARGIVMFADERPVVLCAVDWVGIANGGYDEFRSALAAAAGTTPDRVAVQCLHQHDAPGVDFTAEKLLAGQGLAGRLCDESFARDAIFRTAAAIRESLRHPKQITHVGSGRAVVSGVASNRRVVGPDGQVKHVRYSSCRDEAVRSEPEGVIDPYVQSVSFWNGGDPIACLTYFATHPQSHYGQGGVSCDFVGLARGLREKAVPGVPHVHFCGAAGNVTAGKYNDGSPEQRSVLAQRLADGMKQAWETTRRVPIASADVRWRVQPVALPPRRNLESAKLRAVLANHDAPERERVRAAWELAWKDRRDSGHRIELSCLKLGDTFILNMPGELFIEYQLAAQQLRPESQVCMAAYGDVGPGYIGTRFAYTQGGYETGPVSRVAPEVEDVLLGAIQKLLDCSKAATPQPPFYPDKHSLLLHIDRDNGQHPIRSTADWSKRRADIVAGMELVLGRLPADSNKPRLDVKTIEEVRGSGFIRRKLSFRSDSESRVPAYLFLPEGPARQDSGPANQEDRPARKFPAVLCLHQTVGIGMSEPAGLGGNPNMHYALELARRGYVTLAPDYPSLGEYAYDFGGQQRYTSGSMKAVWDNVRAVDLLESLPEVDAARIGVIGHSLGGHNAMFTAVFEPRLRAIVSSCGFTCFHKDDMPSWTGPRYMPRIASFYGSRAEMMPFDFTEIVAAIAPRPFLACAAEEDDDFAVSGVRDVMEAARPVYELFGQSGALQAYYPKSKHDFPIDARNQAYLFLDKFLKP